jgi:hypothetical protein
MSVFANIQRLLDEKLKSMAGVPFISWPNAETKPGNAALVQYLKPTLLLGDTQMYTLNDYERIPGIYQIDIYGQLNRGVQQVHSIADEIKTHFEANRQLEINGTMVLIQNINMGPSLREDSWYRGYVEVNFICFNN